VAYGQRVFIRIRRNSVPFCGGRIFNRIIYEFLNNPVKAYIIFLAGPGKALIQHGVCIQHGATSYLRQKMPDSFIKSEIFKNITVQVMGNAPYAFDLIIQQTGTFFMILSSSDPA
jgi:hypothetical protein